MRRWPVRARSSPSSRPELIVVFGPDHYNGFFYDMMPSLLHRRGC